MPKGNAVLLNCLREGVSADPMRAAILPDRSEAAVIDSWGWGSQEQQHKSLLEPFNFTEAPISCSPLKGTMRSRLVSTSLKKFPVGSRKCLLKIAPDMPKDYGSDPNEGHRSIKAPACFVNTLTVKQMPGTAGPGPPPAHIHNLLTELEQAAPHL
ncbi:unnamed protein product [Leuciscus chuanchicus]